MSNKIINFNDAKTRPQNCKTNLKEKSNANRPSQNISTNP